MTDASPRRPRTPATVRVAGVLIFVAIGYRLVLIFGSIKGLVEGTSCLATAGSANSRGSEGLSLFRV